ncbi:MAG: hypothetical protein K2Y21_12930 [Phycisphaerales bacterium]|nr:hypothetical protein [Phycisphaerales bacterium]
MLEILQRPDFTLEMCADEFQVTLPALCAFLTSDRGLLLLAHTELAQAIHIRAIAIAQLPRVIDAMTYALEDFAHTCRNVPINPKSMQALEFVERAKDTAGRNGQLLLRLAHFTPRPLRAYAPPALPRPAQRGEDRLAKGQAGEGNETHLNTHAVQYTTAAAPLPSTNPTRQRGATDASITHPIPDHQPLPSPSPVLTSPERERVGHSAPITSPVPHQVVPESHLQVATLEGVAHAPTQPVPLTISAPREERPAPRPQTPTSRAPPLQPCG